MKEVLLTVSGNIDPDLGEQTRRGLRPQADYIAMAQEFDADLIDYTAAFQQTGWFGKLLALFGGKNLTLAWACARRAGLYRVLFTDGEQVGIPLAFFLKFFRVGRRPRHLMIAHILSVGKKMLLLDLLRLYSHIDTIFVYSTWQKKFIETRWQLPSERVVFTPFMVDTQFFSKQPSESSPHLPVLQRIDKPIICAVGLEYRDYPTLMAAVQGLDVQVIIAAASFWSKQRDTTHGQVIPANVIVSKFSQYELRSLYTASRFMVMPLYNVNFQAGVTAILEAMAMGKAVISSHTPGQTDVVVDGQTGLYVPPEDPKALRDAITSLLENPSLADEMGEKGRQRVVTGMSLECYVQRLNLYVRSQTYQANSNPARGH